MVGEVDTHIDRLSEFNRTLITISGAIFAAVTAFSSYVVPDSTFSLNILLVASMIALFMSTFLAVLSQAKTVNFYNQSGITKKVQKTNKVRCGSTENTIKTDIKWWAAGFTNWSFVSLLIGFSLLLIVGISRNFPAKSNYQNLVDASEQFLQPVASSK